MIEIRNIGVLGGGAWGTALALVAARAGNRVVLWVRDPAAAVRIAADNENKARLPGFVLEPGITVTSELAALADVDAVVIATPAQVLGATMMQFAKVVTRAMPAVIAAKGIERDSGRFMSEVLAQAWPLAQVAVLSGPSFASDVARGLPAALTIATPDEALGEALAMALGYRHFRLYWTRDLRGVELGGAVKNVLAIAAGIVDGKGLGPSAAAGLNTRGFAELRRLGLALGARPETLMGLSGLGDLVLTASSPQSRNMSLGRLLGQGRSLAQALASRTAVTEGVATAAAVVRIAAAHGVEMPIATAVEAVVAGRISVDAAIEGLLSRPFKAEV